MLNVIYVNAVHRAVISFHSCSALQQLQAPSSLQALITNAKHWSSLSERFAHPYQYELEQLEPTAEQLKLIDPKVHRNKLNLSS